MSPRPVPRARVLAALLAGLAAAALPAEPMRLRTALAVEPFSLATLAPTSPPVEVLIVARERPRGPAAPLSREADRIEARRAAAEENTRSIRARLATPAIAASRTAPRFLWSVNAVAARVDAATLAALRADRDVAAIYEDRYVEWQGLEATAPGAAAAAGPAPATGPAGALWGLERTGVPTARKNLNLWGKGVLIGHIDSGVDAAHPRLAGRIARFRDFVAGKPAAYDDRGHGTHTAGTLVGLGVGIAPQAKLVVAKSLDQKGGGKVSALLEAMQWMLDPDGNPATRDRPRIVNCSWGAPLDKVGAAGALLRDAVKAWRDAGIIPVFASGNAGPGFQGVPGGFPEALAVGASGPDDQVTFFSSSADFSWDGVKLQKPDLVAPGLGVLSTLPAGKLGTDNGTSMAAPHVSGCLALLLEARPDLDPARIEAALLQGAVDLAPAGRDLRAGVGRLDLLRTLSHLGR